MTVVGSLGHRHTIGPEGATGRRSCIGHSVKCLDGGWSFWCLREASMPALHQLSACNSPAVAAEAASAGYKRSESVQRWPIAGSRCKHSPLTSLIKVLGDEASALSHDTRSVSAKFIDTSLTPPPAFDIIEKEVLAIARPRHCLQGRVILCRHHERRHDCRRHLCGQLA